MTDGVPVLERLRKLDADQRAELIARLSPEAALALRRALPVSARALARARADTADPVGWIRRHLPELMPLEPGPHHRTIAELLPTDGPEGVRAVIGAPRGSGKSTTALSAAPIVAAVRRSHRFVVIIRDNLPDAVTSVEGIRRALDARPELVERYPWIRPFPGPQGTLTLEGGVVIMARSTGSAIRGLNRTLPDGSVVRPDLVIGDDLEDEESARSALQVSRLEEWLLSVIGQLGGPPGDQEAAAAAMDLVVIGTTLERGALVSRMLDGTGPFRSWRRFRFPSQATVDLRDGARVAVDTEGEPVAIPVPDDAEPGTRISLWPAGMPLSAQDRLTDPDDELFIGSILFAREHLLRPQARSDAMFVSSRTRWVEGLADRWLSGDLTRERESTAVDPAISVRDAADYTAVVVVGLYRPFGSREDGTPWPPRLVVPYAERRHCGPAELLTWVEDVARLWTPNGRVSFEAEGAFAWGAHELQRRRGVSVRAVTSGGDDKRTRAMPLSVWQEAGRLEIDAALRGTVFDHELHGFTGTGAEEHDDLVDALVYGARYATRAWKISA